MNCIKCNGIGFAKVQANKGGRRRIVTVDCNDCKGTGMAAHFDNGTVTLPDGRVFIQGITLPFTTTAGKQGTCSVQQFYVSVHFLKATHTYPPHWYPLKDIWFSGVNTATGAECNRPLWSSIALKKQSQLFESNKVERK